MTDLEKTLHKDVKALLDSYEALGVLRYTATKREAVRGLKQGKQAKQSGFKKGLPDFMVFMRGGKTIFIELKANTGTLQPEQEQWRDWLKQADYAWFEARSLQEVREIVGVEL